MNDKRVERIWRREGLKVPKKQPKRGRLWLADGSCVRLRPEHRNHVWSYDFVEDRTHDGRKYRMLNVLDEFTHENRLKECQGELFADRTPTATMRANQLRLWLSSMAYVLMCAVRRIGLAGTKLERATCGTIRLQLLKIGALVTVSVRRVKVAFASACPSRDTFVLAQRRLCA